MGVAGTLEYFSELLSSAKKGKKKKILQTVDLKVRMDCEGCALKVKKTLSSLKGVKSVDVNLKQQKASVTGNVDAKKVLKKAQSTKKKVELWPYVPYNLVAHPYVAPAYDKKAPPGYVRKTEDTAISSLSTVEEQYTTMFSDENPNACSIM
ncbi:heavy metal-associated isoprenylated plant protein 23-like [Cornus florida]|uniref:heavy metal-associated isoprenylated plant protein 23-like n=1 Tax=Cornus florida TaxID=4283 RepID=UPI00289998FF|nr:heavy metal-associated isoprenylated plant protein 23-like [Cornus florida]